MGPENLQLFHDGIASRHGRFHARWRIRRLAKRRIECQNQQKRPTGKTRSSAQDTARSRKKSIRTIQGGGERMKISFEQPLARHRPVRGFGIVFEPPGSLFVYCFIGRIVLLFKTHVQCNSCGKPAMFKCVHGNRGLLYPRQPLCSDCGSLGPCPSDTQAIHQLIPKDQIMVYQREDD